MIYTLAVLSPLGNSLNQILPVGILGYRNEKKNMARVPAAKFPNFVSFLLRRKEPMTCVLHALAGRVRFNDEMNECRFQPLISFYYLVKRCALTRG